MVIEESGLYEDKIYAEYMKERNEYKESELRARARCVAKKIKEECKKEKIDYRKIPLGKYEEMFKRHFNVLNQKLTRLNESEKKDKESIGIIYKLFKEECEKMGIDEKEVSFEEEYTKRSEAISNKLQV